MSICVKWAYPEDQMSKLHQIFFVCYSVLRWHCTSGVVPYVMFSYYGLNGSMPLIQSFINKSKRSGYCSPDLPDFENLCTSMFNKVLNTPTHVLQPLLPPPNSTQPYGLRTRAHNRTLPQRKSHLADCNFIIRMLYLNAYWQSFLTTVLMLSLVACSLCVRMRFVILSIKHYYYYYSKT